MSNTNGRINTRTKKILFVTNAESGQANTILALALEASTRPHIEVHIASFPGLKKRVQKLSPKFTFYPLDGRQMFEMLEAWGLSERDLPHPPATKSYEGYNRLGLGLAGWDGEAYMRIHDSVKKVIEGLNPELIVIDSLFNAALDACYTLNRSFVLNSPNTGADVAKTGEPWWKGFWYYPFLATGISFPVPWRDLPLNIMAALVLTWKMARSPEVNNLIKYRNAHGLPGWLPLGSAPTRAMHIVCPGIREVDFPLVAPNNLGLYGPIVLDAIPIEISDPELNQWLNRGKTVLMCMGTHFHYSASQVKAVINGFLHAVGSDSNTQFLWKLPDKSDFDGLIEEALGNPRDADRFKIFDWFTADLASIMHHPNVAVWIHHGGANSYFEGALSGLPQIILAQWADLYDMAIRAEYRGIGIYGNRKVAPDIEALEFGTAIARLVRPGKESEEFRMRAKAVAEACRKAGGKRAAVDKLMEIIDDE